ncbi:MAG: TonB-dependent receptor [Gammaproteobacteria bacterium]|nr:TonB-dependent receptor [Gammaproteobacteria bacterium]
MLLFSPVATAQLLEEVIVTAQKREQSIQDVGIAVTAFSGDLIKNLNFTNTIDITQQVPSMQYFTYTPSLTILNIRGISQSNFQDNLEAPVAAYVDEAYISSMNMVGQQMFDIERVEVLRGPQGTLFGRNATGGVVQYVTRGATDEEVNGYIEASYAEYDRKYVEGAVGGALADNVRARFAGRWEKGDGYVEALSNEWLASQGQPEVRDSHGADGFVLRGSVQVDLSEQLLADLRVTYLEDNDVPTGTYTWRPATADFEGGTGFGIAVAEPGDPLGFDPFDLDAPSKFQPSSDPRSHYSDDEGSMSRDGWNVTAKFTWDVGDNMKVESITNYQTFDKYYIEDADAGPFITDRFQFITTADFESWTQELRVSGEAERLRWTVGGFYFDQSMNNTASVTGSILTASPTGVIFAPYEQNSENWSIFGQGEYDLTEQLTFIVGLRWSEDDKDFDYTSTFTDVDDAGYTAFAAAQQGAGNVYLTEEVARGGPFNTAQSTIAYNDWAARFQLDFRPNDDTLLFASVNRGIKGGNWAVATVPDFRGPVDVSDVIRHDEEVLWSYEVGGKFSLFKGTARLNTTAFYYDYNDYQVFSLIFLQPDVLNSDAKAYGGEVELALSPSDNWDFNFGVALMSSKVDETPTVFGEFFVEGDLPQAPDISFNFLGRYNWAVPGGNMAVQLDGFIYGDHYLYSAKNDVNFEEGYGILNASVSYTTSDGKWKASAWVKNLTDTEYRIYLVDLGLAAPSPESPFGFLEEIYGPPQWFGGSVSYSF